MSTNPFNPLTPESDYGRTIFDPDDAQVMQQHGLITTPSSAGMVRVSKRRLRESSDTDDSTIAGLSDEPGSATSATSRQAPDLINMPFVLNSRATLIWLGFNSHVAQQLFEKWSSWSTSDPERPSDVCGVAKDYVRRSPFNAGGIDEQWSTALEQIGVEAELKAAFLDPECKQVRNSADLKTWLIDTINIRQRALDDVSKKSNERKGERSKKKGKFTGSAKEFENLELREPVRPEVTNWPATPKQLPEHLLLWKGVDAARVDGLLSEDGQLVDFETILGHPPGDFSGVTAVWYFTVSKDIAEQYARWAMRRMENKGGNVCLVAVQMPKSLVESLETCKLYFPSKEWKTVVHRSRKGRPLPEDLSHLETVELMMGHICVSTTSAVASLASPDEIVRENVMRIPNTNTLGTQHVFTLRARFKIYSACERTVSLHQSKWSK